MQKLIDTMEDDDDVQNVVPGLSVEEYLKELFGNQGISSEDILQQLGQELGVSTEAALEQLRKAYETAEKEDKPLRLLNR